LNKKIEKCTKNALFFSSVNILLLIKENIDDLSRLINNEKIKIKSNKNILFFLFFIKPFNQTTNFYIIKPISTILSPFSSLLYTIYLFSFSNQNLLKFNSPNLYTPTILSMYMLLQAINLTNSYKIHQCLIINKYQNVSSSNPSRTPQQRRLTTFSPLLSSNYSMSFSY